MRAVEEIKNSAESPPGRAFDLDVLLDGVDSLPPSPYPLPELFKALSDPNADLSHVVDLISSDPALTANLLHLCNSAFSARGKAANTVGEAVSRLGFRTVYRVVASIRSPQLFRPSKADYGIDPREVWKHSVVAAMAAQFMADDFGEDSGVLFTAGLLHDLGKVLLSQKFKHEYGRVLAAARQLNKPLCVMETGAFGVDHAQLGARLLERWGFSPELVASVRFHHEPHRAAHFERFAAMVHVASAFSHMHHPLSMENGIPHDPQPGLAIFGWSADELGRYSSRLSGNMPLLKAMLQLGG
jgi:putative nucleotidyltransferase with HDIG domain